MEQFKYIFSKAMKIFIGIPATFGFLSILYILGLLLTLFTLLVFSAVALVYVVYMSIYLPFNVEDSKIIDTINDTMKGCKNGLKEKQLEKENNKD